MNGFRNVACAAAVALSAGAADAAGLSVIGGDAGFLGMNFSSDKITELSIGDALLAFPSATKSAAEGLSVGGTGTVKVTLLGFDASYDNVFRLGGFELGNLSSPIGASFTTGVSAGLLNFTFENLNFGGKARNASNSVVGHDLGFVVLSDHSVIALFDDPTTDVDYDDLAVLIEFSPIPIPASLGLFVLAMGGMISLGRRRNLV